MLKKQLELANQLRETAEDLVESQKYGFDYFDPDLECLCAIWSVALQRIFDQNGIESEVICGEFRNKDLTHCWVETGTHIIDITATQFKKMSKRKVVFLDKNDEEAKDLYRNGEVVEKPKYFHKWPDEQKPTKAKIEKIIQKWSKNYATAA